MKTLLIVCIVLALCALSSAAQALDLCPGEAAAIEWGADPDADYYLVEVSENGGPMVQFAETGLLSIDYNPAPGVETMTAQVTPMNNCGGSGEPVAATEAIVQKQNPTRVPFVRVVTAGGTT